jgi:3-oxoacyl-[acyl-carrier-protein] synthase-3
VPKSKFTKAKISGIVTCIPENYRLLDEEVDALYNGDLKKVNRIKRSIGLNKRHIVDKDTTTADLCEVAARNLLDGTRTKISDIDTIIVVTQTPDYFQPATAAYLHGRLGLSDNCAAFDVNQGCTGYIYGLWLAFMMIETKSCENVLLLAGDTISKVVSLNDPNVTPLFGDAGSATLIQKSDNIDYSFFILHVDGSKFDAIIQPKGAFRNPSLKQINDKRIFETSRIRSLQHLYMDGAEIFNFSIKTEPVAINEILEFSQTNIDAIDYIIFHQANKYIISNIARRLKLPLEKAPSDTTGKYGNQSSASIPCTICDAIRNKVITKKVNLILSGFGVGLSWGSCQLKLDKIYCPEILYYEKEIKND